MTIKYYKWDKKQRNKLFYTLNKELLLSNCQFYQPYFSLYFHLYNTKNSHKTIDINRRYFIKEVLDITKDNYDTSNNFVNCLINDNKNKTLFEEELFCKCVPILDPLHFIMNNYNNNVHRNPLLPSNYSYNTFQKINDMNNNAYIDSFFSFISSELTLQDINPSFPIFYGSINGIKENFKYDITEDYYDFKDEKWFQNSLGKLQTIDMYVSSSDEETDEESSSDSEYNNIHNNDYISIINDIPCQNFFIEKLEGTLEDLLGDIEEMNTELILSCIFQISFALSYLQKHYNFTHNDLHVNNVMFKKTDKIFLYYKFNNIYYKVPTHGYIFKIIDFGRAIFTYNNKTFFNDTFDKHGEAGSQYTYPYDKLLFNKNEDDIVKPNYNFDLCRLAITIIDVCNFDFNKDHKKKQSFVDFIRNMTIDNQGESLADLDDDFNMYISISKRANNSLPSKIIQNYIFNHYRIKKKAFPKKLYYSLN